MDERTSGNEASVKKSRLLYRIAGIVIVLLVLSTIYLCVSMDRLSVRLSATSDKVDIMENRTVDLEKKQTGLQSQLTHLDGKVNDFSDWTVLELKELESLTPRVNRLEKKVASIQKKITADRKKPLHAGKKRYHEVKEGENLFRISLRYGLSVERLRKMNHLEGDVIQVGQKLVVSR